MNKKMKKTKGYVVITTVIFFLVISLAVISGVVIPTTNHIKAINNEQKAKQGYIAADTVNEDAYYRLNNGWTLPATLSLPFSNGVLASASVTVNGEDTQVLTTGTNGTTVRYAQTLFRSTDVTAFNYGAQIGTGGLSFSGGSWVTGDVYSNGSITGDSSVNSISGSVTVANVATTSVNQTNKYTNGTSPVAVLVGGATNSDVAQSFKVTSNNQLKSIRLYIKKTGTSPANNMTLRIVPDLSGKPSNTGVLGTGTLTGSTITTSYTYVDVPISPNPSLTVGSTYWFVIDGVSGHQYHVAATNNTYSNGIARLGNWSSNSSNNTWTTVTPTNSDLYFDIFLNAPNTISGNGQWNRLNIGGVAWANKINNSSVTGIAYCQTSTYLYNGSNATKTCNTTRADPEPLDYPITDQDILDWKAIAEGGGVINSNQVISGGTSVTLGPKKIVGNLTVTGGSTLNLSGTLWVTGYIDLNGGSQIRLASTAGSSDGMIIADGRIIVSGGAFMRGSGTSGSYMVAMTTSQCPTSGTCSGAQGTYATSISGGSGSIAVFAPYGTVLITGGAEVNSLIAKTAIIDGGSRVVYDTGLSSIDFLTQTGGGGSGSLWNVESWEEVSQ